MIYSKLLRRKEVSPQSISSGNSISAMGAYGEAWEDEEREHYVRAYRDRVWVQRCVNLIASSFTQVEIKALRGGEELEEHRIIDLLKRPNPRDPALMFFEWSAKWSQIVGEWYWELIPARDGGIAELYPMKSHLVRVKPGEGGKYGGYTYDPEQTGNSKFFAAADPMSGTVAPNSVISGRFANPLNDWYGMPPLRGAKDDIISEYHGIRYDHRFFRNSARPDLALLFEGKLSTTERKANKEEWTEFKGGENAHKAAVLSGVKDIKLLTQSQKDVEYLEGRRLAREGQCAAFGVPPVLVGDLTRATYSNFKESETIFWKITMLPLLEFMASWANFTIVPFFDGVDEIAFDTSGIQALQESENDRMERLVKGKTNGIITPNEAREDLGEEQLADPAADRLYQPLSQVAFAGEGVEELAQQQATNTQQSNSNQTEKRRSYRTKNDFAAFRALREKFLDHIWRATQPEIAKVFETASAEVRGIVAGKAKVSDLERTLEAYGWADLGKKLSQVVENMYLTVSDEAIRQLSDAIGADVSFGGDGAEVQQLVKELANRADGIGTVEGRVKTDVIEEVRHGIAKGIPNRGIAEGGTFDVGPPGARDTEQVTIKGVKGVFENYQTWEAERIARTESAVAYNRSSTLAMRDVGITQVDIIDGAKDDICAAANGSTWTLEEFESNPIGHPNCTRIGLPVIP